MATQYEVGHLVAGTPDMDDRRECPECGFDSLLSFPITALSRSGVTPWGTYSACARCYGEGE